MHRVTGERTALCPDVTCSKEAYPPADIIETPRYVWVAQETEGTIRSQREQRAKDPAEKQQSRTGRLKLLQRGLRLNCRGSDRTTGGGGMSALEQSQQVLGIKALSSSGLAFLTVCSGHLCCRKKGNAP